MGKMLRITSSQATFTPKSTPHVPRNLRKDASKALEKRSAPTTLGVGHKLGQSFDRVVFGSKAHLKPSPARYVKVKVVHSRPVRTDSHIERHISQRFNQGPYNPRLQRPY